MLQLWTRDGRNLTARDGWLQGTRTHRQIIGLTPTTSNTKPIEPAHGDKNYFFDKDMADKAIERIRLLHSIAPDKPWVTYYAPGTAHAPHHAPKD
jgi:arylsulfatase A-like enzyme